jgi:hypothetical protein
MANNALTYYINNSPQSLSGVAVYYNYNTTGSYIQNATGYNILSGKLFYNSNGQNLNNQDTATFWRVSGSGFYNGACSYIQTTGIIDLANTTYAMVYEKSGVSDAVLVSTIYTGSNSGYGNYYGGYEFGVTANNYLYFQYFDINSGVQMFTSNEKLSNKALVYLSLNRDTVSFGNYDYFYQKINVNRNFVNGNYFFDPSGAYIAYNPNYSRTYSRISAFTGYIDELVIFSPQINSSSIQYIASGFANNYTGTIYGNQGLSGAFTGVTGSKQLFTGFYTQVTGYAVAFTPILITDYFGNQYWDTVTTPLTGISSGYITVQSTGSSLYPTGTVSSQDVLILDSGYIYSFGKNAVSFLCPIYSNDMVDINLPDQNYSLKYRNNLNLKYNYIKNSFYDEYLSNLSGISYLPVFNGLAQNSGSSFVTGTYYTSGLGINLDYIIGDGSEVYFQNNHNFNKDPIQDVTANTITGTYNNNLYIKNLSTQSRTVTTVKNWVSYSNTFDQWYGYYGTNTRPRGLKKDAVDPFGVTSGAWSFPISGCTNPGGGFYNENSDIVRAQFPINTPIISSFWIKSDNPNAVNFQYNFGVNYCNGGNIQLTTSWQRVHITGSWNGDNGCGGMQLYMAFYTSDANTTGNVYMYGAQVETGYMAHHYVENTGTNLNTIYSIPWNIQENNIFYNGQKLITGTYTQLKSGTVQLSNTTHEYTTGKNLLLYSQNFNSTTWKLAYTGSSGVLGFTDNITDAFATNFGSVLIYTGINNSNCNISQYIPVDPSTQYTFSLYLTTGQKIGGKVGWNFAAYDTAEGGIYPTNYIGDITGTTSISYIVTGDAVGVISQLQSYPYASSSVYPYTGASSHTSYYTNYGWYRHQWTFTTSQYTKGIKFSLWPSGYNIPCPSGAYIGMFASQLERGSGATDYSKTFDSINTQQSNGLLVSLDLLPFSGSSGQLFALPKNYTTEITGSSQNFYGLTNFADNFSEIYKNGVRLNPNNDYIELGKYDTCSGAGIFDTKSYSLYNNSNLFY